MTKPNPAATTASTEPTPKPSPPPGRTVEVPSANATFADRARAQRRLEAAGTPPPSRGRRTLRVGVDDPTGAGLVISRVEA